MFFCGVSTRRGLDRWSALELSDQRETCGDTWINYRTVYRQHGGTRPMSKTHDSKLYLKNRMAWMSLIPTDTSLPSRNSSSRANLHEWIHVLIHIYIYINECLIHLSSTVWFHCWWGSPWFELQSLVHWLLASGQKHQLLALKKSLHQMLSTENVWEVVWNMFFRFIPIRGMIQFEESFSYGLKPPNRCYKIFLFLQLMRFWWQLNALGYGNWSVLPIPSC